MTALQVSFIDITQVKSAFVNEIPLYVNTVSEVSKAFVMLVTAWLTAVSFVPLIETVTSTPSTSSANPNFIMKVFRSCYTYVFTKCYILLYPIPMEFYISTMNISIATKFYVSVTHNCQVMS